MRVHPCMAATSLFMAGLLAGCATVVRPFVSGSASAPDAPPAASPPVAPGVEAARAPDEPPAARPTALPLEAPPYAARPSAQETCGATPCAPICGLPCESGRGGWHVRALGGYGFSLGEDPANPCNYFGGDIGYTLCGTKCGCWGIDAFYRTQSPRFERDPGGEDGGDFHFVGVKLTYERSIHGRWYGWAGAGPEHFWTDGYLDDDSGFGVFAEAGIGYMLSCSWRLRAGVEVHGLDTDVGRQSTADDGQSRWLWLVAPVVGLEFDF